MGGWHRLEEGDRVPTAACGGNAQLWEWGVQRRVQCGEARAPPFAASLPPPLQGQPPSCPRPPAAARGWARKRPPLVGRWGWAEEGRAGLADGGPHWPPPLLPECPAPRAPTLPGAPQSQSRLSRGQGGKGAAGLACFFFFFCFLVIKIFLGLGEILCATAVPRGGSPAPPPPSLASGEGGAWGSGQGQQGPPPTPTRQGQEP